MNCESKSVNTVVQIQLPSSIDVESSNQFGEVIFRTDVLGRRIDNVEWLNAGQYFISGITSGTSVYFTRDIRRFHLEILRFSTFFACLLYRALIISLHNFV